MCNRRAQRLGGRFLSSGSSSQLFPLRVQKENLLKPILAVLLMASIFNTSFALADDSASIALARSAAESWLKLTDEGAYKQSWNEAASIFKRAISKADWVEALKQARSPLGSTSNRKLANSTFTRTLPGAPEGEYVVLQFETQFEKRSAIETVTPMKDGDGSWRVSGYYVR